MRKNKKNARAFPSGLLDSLVTAFASLLAVASAACYDAYAPYPNIEADITSSGATFESDVLAMAHCEPKGYTASLGWQDTTKVFILRLFDKNVGAGWDGSIPIIDLSTELFDSDQPYSGLVFAEDCSSLLIYFYAQGSHYRYYKVPLPLTCVGTSTCTVDLAIMPYSTSP